MKGRREEHRGIEYYMQLPYSILLHQVEDEGQKYWIAEVPELPGCRSHGSTVEEAVRNVEEAKKDWILDSLQEGEEVPIPVERDRYSGRILLRMSRSLHRALSMMAESEGLSLNQLTVTILGKEVGRFSVLNRVEQKIDNLLDRINDVVAEQRAPSSKSFWVTAGLHEYAQTFVVDTTPDIEAKRQLCYFVYPADLPSAAVSTASPLEQVQRSVSVQPSAREESVHIGTKAKGREDAFDIMYKRRR